MAVPALAVDVTSCGTAVAPRQTAELIGDLDCSSMPGQCSSSPTPCTSDAECGTGDYCEGVAVELGRGATLNMNGFSIIGREVGVRIPRGPATIRHLTSRVRDFGMLGRRTDLLDVTVYRGASVSGTNISAVDVSLIPDPTPGAAPCPGLFASKRLEGENIRAGILYGARGIDVHGFQSNGSCNYFVFSPMGRVKLTDSAVSGGYLFDVGSRKPPILVNTSCGTSARIVDRDGSVAGTWGVCTND
jgi:hypothetical protein